MKEKLTKKYGLLTATAMVVGIVIGSGVFFKAQDILTRLQGNMPLGILAWIIGGLVIVGCATTFAVMASKYEHCGGPVDYAEATCGKTYAYIISWFLAIIYYPAITSVLAWVTARYIGVIFGLDIVGSEVMMLCGVLLLFTYGYNALAPKLAGKLQVSLTVIKMIPLILMALVGTVVGFVNGNIVDGFSGVTGGAGTVGGDEIFGAIVATAFAYDGWIIATSINAEIKDAKRNLPLALFFGCLIIVATYVLYYIGLAGATDVNTLIADGASAAFVALFGKGFAVVLNVFVAVSCFGTLNGLVLATTRGFYACASREDTKPFRIFKSLDPHTNIPNNASLIGLIATAAWLFFFYGANLTSGWFGVFNFDSSELPIITLYGLYIPIFINFMRKEKSMGVFRRFVLPSIATAGAVFMIFATVYSHGIQPFLKAQAEGKFAFPVLFYLIVFAVVVTGGLVLRYVGRRMDNKTNGQKTDPTDESIG